MCLYDLWFRTCQKSCNMLHSIHSLKSPFLYKVLMRNVTIITSSIY